MDRLSIALLVFSSVAVLCSSQLLSKAGFNCTAKKTCGECVAESPECHWCKKENYIGERCNYKTVLNQTNCAKEDVVSPKSQMEYIKNVDPRNKLDDSPPIQLAPQEIRIKLRPNEPFQFQMNFRQAENYPVDIYFIMDVSFTMKDYKKTLSDFTGELVTKIRNITTDFRLGFGSFVDKTILPFIQVGPNSVVIDQCSKEQNCALPHGFRNQLSLTDNVNEFKQRVASLPISANLDAPEGGFDAIMQAIVCDEIGWRNQSRKMILFSTDGSFHYAGDGKLGGIVIPNDRTCHLNNQGYYSESTNQDYPSISQLAQEIAERKVNVIFMVPKGQFQLYRRLSEHIVGSNVSQLANDSSNVIDLVQENYDRIRSAVELKAEDQGDLRITYSVKCSPEDPVRSKPQCEGLEIGQTVSFKVTIEAESCGERSEWNRTVTISPIGLTEKLTINLELICECPCELPGAEIPNSRQCNTSGTYECGICTCNKGFYGKTCQCGAASFADDLNYEAPCKMTNISDVCQGKGQCECGQCVCGLISTQEPTKRYSGTYCECNDHICDYSRTDSGQSEICGGSSRGVCVCGKCHCIGDYKGASCDCLNSTKHCIAKSGSICNGKGVCECGSCKCNDVFKGPTCEDCPTCPGKCEENRECVQCKFREEGNKCFDDCKAKNMTITMVPDLTDFSDLRQCVFRDEDQCDIRFAYNYTTNEVKVQRTKECVYRASNLVIILSVIGGVIALGIIALLIWKFVVTFYDKREYEAFVEEQSKAKWDVAQNPVYKPATTNFQNPTYRPGSTINN